LCARGTPSQRVRHYDHSHDIAVLQLQGASGLQTVNLGDSGSATPGQKVVAQPGEIAPAATALVN